MKDASKLAPILEEAYRHIHGEHLDEQLLVSTPREKLLQSVLTAQYQTTHVARCEDEVLGFVSFGPRLIPGLGYARHVVEVSMLAVRPEYRREGVGSALFESMVSELRTRPFVKSLCLWVESENVSARRFYEKMEMREDGTRGVRSNLMRRGGTGAYTETKYTREICRLF